MNVKTNVGKKFLNIVSKNFPKTHRFHGLFNRNNLKVSYSCLPNISSIISSHNKTILNTDYPEETTKGKTCNCQKKNSCPLNGKCLDKEIIYRCKIQKPNSNEDRYYIGLTANTFKQRWYSHNHSFKHEDKKKSTELSNYIWGLRDNNIEPTLSWEVIDHARPYVNGSKKCNLCLTEKFHIITSQLDIVNKRSEIISKCRHSNNFMIKNFKAIPPDKTPRQF